MQRHGGIGSIPGLVGAHAAIATVSSSFLIGFSFPRWVSYVEDGTPGGLQAGVVIVSLLLVLVVF